MIVDTGTREWVYQIDKKGQGGVGRDQERSHFRGNANQFREPVVRHSSEHEWSMWLPCGYVGLLCSFLWHGRIKGRSANPSGRRIVALRYWTHKRERDIFDVSEERDGGIGIRAAWALG